MSHNTFMLLTTLLIQFGWISSQPADLGAFGTQNDIQTGISTYPIPSQSERNLPSELYVLAFINYTNDGDIFNEEVAKFGEGPVPTIVTGQLIHITTDDDDRNHTACSKNLRGTHGEPLPGKEIQWIALIKRGHCKFDEKVQNVIGYNAAAVIIYNDEDRKDLHKMRIEPQTRDIPAIFTYKEVGEQMAEILDTSALTVSIVKGRLGKPIPNINRTSVLFVSISFIVLMIISFVWLVFYYVQRFRYLQTKDRKSRQLCTVAKRVIAKIPTKTFKSDESNDSDRDCCAICIEPYKTTDVIRVLPCKHEFHKSCIDPWLLEHRTCPMCKLDCLKYYGFVFTGSQESILQLDMDIDDSTDANEPNPDDFVIRAHGVSPSFIIQLDTENVRRHSVESPESDTDREFRNYRKHPRQSTVVSGSKHLYPATASNRLDRDSVSSFETPHRASISLPCTLRKSCTNSDTSCRGNNNCYAWSLDGPHTPKRNDDSSTACAIVNKCLSTATKQQTDKSDSEFLLLNEHEPELEPELEPVHGSNGVCNSKPILLSDADEIEPFTAHASNDGSDKNHNNSDFIFNGNQIGKTIDL